MYFDAAQSGAVFESRRAFAASEEGGPSPRRGDAFRRRAERVRRSVAKRALDIVVATLLLVALLPLMLLIALAIRIEGGGPVLFRQRRYGVDRKIFRMLKFRSMTVLESSGPFLQVGAGDVRITRVGRFLRRTSLDELPQLLNVLGGQMSLVGPRPHAVAMDDAYALVLPNYRDRHAVRPGITGPSQIAGLRGPTDATDKMVLRLRRDRAYIRAWSIGLDIKILLLTPLYALGPNAF